MSPRLRTALLALVLVLALGAAGCGADEAPPAGGGASGSTLRSTLIDPDGDGALERGPGEPLRDRTELAPASRPGRTIATLGQLTDTHVRDEESPARVPFLDRFGAPLQPTFRPQEALSAQVLDAAVRSVNRERPDAVVVTGDLIDNAQRNELALLRTLLDGGRANPDSGGRGYRGVQERANPDPLYYRPDLDPPSHPGMLDAAQRPFDAPGLRAPWYPAMGNHDILRQGYLPAEPRTDAVATGTRLVTSLDRDFRLPDDFSTENASAAVDALLDAGTPGDAIEVPADPDRVGLRADEAVRLLGRGHALRVPDRLDYTFDSGALRVIVLDTVNRTGTARGVVTPAQVTWLRARLAAAAGRPIVVVSHNRLDGSDGGAAAVAALGESPDVVANVSGNVHRSRVRPQRTAAGGYWVIETSSLADFPQQARMLRLRDTADGGRVLETWMVDQDGQGLAGVSRELAYLDAQGGRPQGEAGTRLDRNVRLYLPPRARR